MSSADGTHISVSMYRVTAWCILRALQNQQKNGSGIYSISQKYAHGFVVLCFVVVMQSFIMNSHEVFIHIHQGCFAGTGAIVRLPQCQWSKPGGYGKISQCITTTKHSKAKTVCIFLGIYCINPWVYSECLLSVSVFYATSASDFRNTCVAIRNIFFAYVLIKSLIMKWLTFSSLYNW